MAVEVCVLIGGQLACCAFALLWLSALIRESVVPESEASVVMVVADCLRTLAGFLFAGVAGWQVGWVGQLIPEGRWISLALSVLVVMLVLVSALEGGVTRRSCWPGVSVWQRTLRRLRRRRVMVRGCCCEGRLVLVHDGAVGVGGLVGDCCLAVAGGPLCRC